MNLIIAMILVFMFSKGQDVMAAQCFQSKMGWWRCSACGRGTRCIFCEWCLGYCYKKGNSNGRRKRSVQNTTYGEVEVPYKKPFIDCYHFICCT